MPSAAINQAIDAMRDAHDQLNGNPDLIQNLGQAQVALEQLRAQIVAHDDRLNDAEEVPTGDSYNELTSLLGVAALKRAAGAVSQLLPAAQHFDGNGVVAVVLANGDQAAGLDGSILATSELGMRDADALDVARNVARALGQDMRVYELPTPEAEDWTFADLFALLRKSGAQPLPSDELGADKHLRAAANRQR